MEEKYDYAAAIAELEDIARKVEDPETKLDGLDTLVARSRMLIRECREYLRTVKDRIDALEED